MFEEHRAPESTRAGMRAVVLAGGAECKVQTEAERFAEALGDAQADAAQQRADDRKAGTKSPSSGRTEGADEEEKNHSRQNG